MKTLVIVTGPTASGKTGLAIDIAESLDTEIVSADSRQIYRGIPIGTAVPSADELARVRHHFIETLPLDSYYSAARYEEEALTVLGEIWRKRDIAVMCGGSMMYIDAVTRGIDQLPTISDEVRERVRMLYEQSGIEGLRDTLAGIDPVMMERIDPSNHRRLMHAIEITLEAGIPCSRLLTGQAKERPFRIVKLAIGHTREALFDRINRRVDAMIEAGLEAEAARVYPQRHLNALNTVGYKELFAVMDGVMTRDIAIPRIAKNTRVYAKKQLLWLSKDPTVNYIDPSMADMAGEALRIINTSLME